MHGCPYCPSDTFVTEFVVLEIGPPLEGFNQCTECHKWSKYVEGQDQEVIFDPLVKPEP